MWQGHRSGSLLETWGSWVPGRREPLYHCGVSLAGVGWPASGHPRGEPVAAHVQPPCRSLFTHSSLERQRQGQRQVVTLGRGSARLDITTLQALNLPLLEDGVAHTPQGCGEPWRAPAP